ncbi:hypothetical protein [Pseudorhodoplanes sp.]|jgi:hypothetical protein|uniref:hypothetical protein n=1 Tax=Pseudorhodoplanes sp. TaxID=1934341 RepID=UPI002CE3BA54|nr:hypothetical protein [Pseudorhodoplanes sp.]HWV40572.1 hypothetical protein [Pseudorhodoplanes sp.]
MLRKLACAVVGIALACAAGSSIGIIAQSLLLTDLDLRIFHDAPSGKADRLATPSSDRAGGARVFDLPAEKTTIVVRNSGSVMESAVRTPRPATTRNMPVQPVRETPNQAPRDRLPEGCEPAFSPVTMPAYAHIGVRCDS